jgi:hypothetical protein
MAEKINFLLDNPDKAKVMGCNGRENLEPEFILKEWLKKRFQFIRNYDNSQPTG